MQKFWQIYETQKSGVTPKCEKKNYVTMIYRSTVEFM
jgi:hypothetical protein